MNFFFYSELRIPKYEETILTDEMYNNKPVAIEARFSRTQR